MGIGGQTDVHAEVGGQAHDGRAGIGLGKGLAQFGRRDFHDDPVIGHGLHGAGHYVQTALFAQPRMEQIIGGPLDEVGMRGHVHQPAGRHVRHLFIIFPVAGIGGLPAVGPGVGTRHREEPHIMQGADHIAERPAGKETAHMPGVVGQPVQLHPQQGQRPVFPLQLPLPQGLHILDELAEIAGERRYIQLAGIFLRQGGMLAQAEEVQPGRGGALVHLGGAVVSVGRVGMGMQVCQHRDTSGGHLRECPAYTLLYQFSPKDTGQSKVK